MANPRKFSDKLEIIRRKEEEANAAFVKIMREVSDARKTTGPPHLPPQNNWARGPTELMNMRQKFKGGSLPNVSQNSMNMQGVYPPGMSDLYRPRQPHHPSQGHNYIGITPAHLRRTMEPPSGPIYPSKNKARSYTVNSAPYRNNLHHQAQPNFMSDQNDSQMPMWRRTYSDSAIHEALQQPPKKNGDGTQQSTPPRVVHATTLQTVDGSNETQQYGSNPPTSLSFNTDTSPNNGKHIQMQANTSSLPDLSNLSIPSPIQNPIDVDQEGKNNQQNHGDQHAFQIPYRVPPRRLGKQIYPRQISSNPDVLESLHREQKLHLNLYSGGVMSGDKNEMNLPNMSHSAPLSPVTPSYWIQTPMSPLASGELMQQVSAQNELQQQLQQFQISNSNGMGNPPPYAAYLNQNENENGGNYNYPYMNSKQNVYRINSGPPQLTTTNNQDSKAMCDRQLESELQRLKAQDSNELSEADLNSVRVALDPLDFNDVQILTDENTELVDQSAEESFRLERAGYQ